MGVLVLVDAENVRRSAWPNVSREQLVELLGAWSHENDRDVLVVYDGPPPDVEPPPRVSVVGTGAGSADDELVRRARELHERGAPPWLVTSDRELRALAAPYVDRTLGGGSFLRELQAS